MTPLAFALIFILGTTIGSFLNVVIYRFNTGRSVSKGRSMCMSCGHALHWYELIPLASFFVQRGKCRRCKTAISFQYPFVEAVTALVFALSAWRLQAFMEVSLAQFAVVLSLVAFVFCLWIVIAVYDLKHKVIPDIFSYSAFFAAVFAAAASGGLERIASSLLAGFLVAAPFALLHFVSRGRWMGLGDAKLALSIGALLGISAGFAAALMSFWIGAAVAIVMLLVSRRQIGLGTEVPFGPYLVVAAWVAFFCSVSFSSIVTFFSF